MLDLSVSFGDVLFDNSVDLELFELVDFYDALSLLSKQFTSLFI